MHICTSDYFGIKWENFDGMLAAINKNRHGNEKYDTVSDWFYDHGWQLCFDSYFGADYIFYTKNDCYDYTIIQFTRLDMDMIAPFVEANSDITFHEDEGRVWRWYFDGKYVIEQIAHIEWAKDV